MKFKNNKSTKEKMNRLKTFVYTLYWDIVFIESNKAEKDSKNIIKMHDQIQKDMTEGH